MDLYCTVFNCRQRTLSFFPTPYSSTIHYWMYGKVAYAHVQQSIFIVCFLQNKPCTCWWKVTASMYHASRESYYALKIGSVHSVLHIATDDLIFILFFQLKMKLNLPFWLLFKTKGPSFAILFHSNNVRKSLYNMYNTTYLC